MEKKLEKSEELKAQEEVLKDESPLKLPDDVAKGYDVTPGHVRVFIDTQSGALVDLNKISLAKAAKLAERGILKKKGS
jgi:hypothetical protein